MSVLYFFTMFVMFFPILAPHTHRPGWWVPGSAGEGTEARFATQIVAPSAHPAPYDRATQVTGVAEAV
jgi:hypothetical protein